MFQAEQSSSSPPGSPAVHKRRRCGLSQDHVLEDIEYRSTWTLLTSAPWRELCRYWWGPTSKGKEELDKALKSQHGVLRVTQPAVWWAFDLLDESNGGILICDDYKFMYDRLCQGFTVPFQQPSYVGGVILTGQSGIGKSYFALYALLRRIAEGQPVLFSTALGETYLKPTNHVRPADLPPYNLSNLRAWSLVGGRSNLGQSGVTARSLFWAVSTSPRRRRYRELEKRTSSRKWILNPSPIAELCFLMSHENDLGFPSHAFDTTEKLTELVETVGPCSRDLRAYVSNPSRVTDSISAALLAIESPHQITSIIKGSPYDMDAYSDRLVLLPQDTVDCIGIGGQVKHSPTLLEWNY
ncbi:hypothetical protein ABKN59_009160 [Abortiporus biennis]